ncbi:MAG: hypothetical protein J6R29_01315 [Clostridia bacterium]|nr:hypothetical protein [Clostridia bacterium]
MNKISKRYSKSVNIAVILLETLFKILLLPLQVVKAVFDISVEIRK